MHQITDRLFVGNISDAIQPPAQISAVLLVAEEYQIEAPTWLAYGRIPFREFDQADPKIVADAVGWMERHMADNRVMVCCRAGMGRSVSVAMAYLCCGEGMAYDDVLRLVMSRRPGALPLPQLKDTIEVVQRIRQADRNHPSG